MSRFPIPRPRSGDRTILPATLAALVAGMLVLQLALARSDELDVGPPTGAGAARAGTPPPLIPLVVVEPVIREQPIFTPARVFNSDASGADALGGVQVAGAWAVGRRMNLVVRDPNGTSRTLRVGQAVNQWVLASITPVGARFSRDGKVITVPFGSSAPPSATADATEQEEESE